MKWDAEAIIYALHVSTSKRFQKLTRKVPVNEDAFRREQIENEVVLFSDKMFSDIYDRLSSEPINIEFYVKNGLLRTKKPEDQSMFTRLLSAQYMTSEVVSQVDAIRGHMRHFIPIRDAYDIAIRTFAKRLGTHPFKGVTGSSFSKYATDFVAYGKDGVLQYWNGKKEI